MKSALFIVAHSKNRSVPDFHLLNHRLKGGASGSFVGVFKYHAGNSHPSTILERHRYAEHARYIREFLF